MKEMLYVMRGSRILKPRAIYWFGGAMLEIKMEKIFMGYLFYHLINNKVLIHPNLGTSFVVSSLHCSIQCISLKNCTTFNLVPSTAMRFSCQLNQKQGTRLGEEQAVSLSTGCRMFQEKMMKYKRIMFRKTGRPTLKPAFTIRPGVDSWWYDSSSGYLIISSTENLGGGPFSSRGTVRCYHQTKANFRLLHLFTFPGKSLLFLNQYQEMYKKTMISLLPRIQEGNRHDIHLYNISQDYHKQKTTTLVLPSSDPCLSMKQRMGKQHYFPPRYGRDVLLIICSRGSGEEDTAAVIYPFELVNRYSFNRIVLPDGVNVKVMGLSKPFIHAFIPDGDWVQVTHFKWDSFIQHRRAFYFKTETITLRPPENATCVGLPIWSLNHQSYLRLYRRRGARARLEEYMLVSYKVSCNLKPLLPSYSVNPISFSFDDIKLEARDRLLPKVSSPDGSLLSFSMGKESRTIEVVRVFSSSLRL
ncbi:uncharacterized protein LOC135502482 [Lineus longissimus]|uniref:uncharacterized protein LOC135502482 n=1 Tax=Lineus longissimus TaxID=88925 RepID=UPI00315CD4D9